MSWRAADVGSADLAPLLKGADVVVSCIGVIGGSDAYMEAGNGDVNAKVSHTQSVGAHFALVCQTPPLGGLHAGRPKESTRGCANVK